MSAVPLSDVPTKLHRVAAQLLEDTRDDKMKPLWMEARLGAMAQPLYRPDVDGEAYYEFTVVTGASAKPAGFITVSTRDHDFPVAHWNTEGASPCQVLEKQAQEAGKPAARFYKLDALAYAVEDDGGELAATSNEQLLRVNGLEMAWLDQEAPLAQASWKPSPQPDDDADAGEVTGVLEVSGPGPIPTVEFTGWESWDQLKSEYAEVFGLLIEAQRRQASSDWQVDSLAEEHGEGLVRDQVYRLACLFPETEFELAGPGADMVEVELVKRDEIPPVLEIRVLDSNLDEEFPLEVILDYPARGLREQVRFAIVEPPVTSGFRTIKLNPGTGSWSAWQESWAGTHNDQRWYDQIPPRTTPNTDRCASGCGNTAWALLFGWADNKAAQGNARWRRRTGLYRRNGGTGSDAVAPATRDAGVWNMTWEIRNRTGSWCDPFSTNGVTIPWDMSRAAGYLQGRTGTRLHADYNILLGIASDSLRNRARRVIKDSGDPAIIGTGYLSHYPLAYGYRYRSRRVRHGFLLWTWYETEYGREFYVNQGWGEGWRSWVPASTWFAGWITPD